MGHSPETDEIIRKLGLVPHPEGGFFRETWRSGDLIDAKNLPARYTTTRSAGTAIYYLITPDSFSRMHRVQTDEVFHFYLGDPVVMLQLHPGGETEVRTLGSNLVMGQEPQLVVPAGSWQGSMLAFEGDFALLGATVAPGFDFEDFEMGDRERLLNEFPDQADLIRRLT